MIPIFSSGIISWDGFANIPNEYVAILFNSFLNFSAVNPICDNFCIFLDLLSN